MKHCDCMPPPPIPHKGPSEYIPSRTYPDPFVNMVPGYVPMHRAGCCGPFVPVCPCPPPPPPPDPQPEWGCPPKIYRNPPEIEVKAGEHITVDKEIGEDNVLATYTVNSVQWPVKIDEASEDVLYGDGTPENPLGVYDFVGATASSDGKPGTVPAPAKNEREYYLRGDGTWSPIVIPEQAQSDWAEESELSPAFIRNKPDIDAKIAVETNRAKKAEAAATTEVKAGENATVTVKTATDGHKIYTVNADGKPQVQADWNQNDSSKVDYIKNRPDIEAMIDSAVSTERDRATEAETTLHTEIVTETERAIAGEAAATTEVKAGENATVTEETAADGHKIYTVNADGKPQVQADWAQEDETKVDYIKNRPDIEAMIDSAVSTERDRATEAEATLHTELVTETERATEAENNLHTEIVTETERAIAGEAAATTEVAAGNNVTVDNSVAADGHNIYTVTVNECSAAMMDAWLDEVG